jgi:hypothetical protein
MVIRMPSRRNATFFIVLAGRYRGWGAAMLLNGIVFTGATAATLVAAYEWTGLPRHWQMRVWNSGLAITLWLMWFYGITSA